ncbi:MAG: NlpC/P60 family protein, partial [Oscillospiraceae bacterium]|nr:NlpC/P60 family protein [Oscillospiraceae bacterium]
MESNPVSRFWQKQRIKKQYAQQAREAARAGAAAAETTAQATGKAAQAAEKATAKAAAFIKRHKGGVVLFLICGMVLALLQSCMSSVITIGQGAVGAITASTYAAEDEDLLGAEEYYCSLEDELQDYLDSYERTHDYDEYHYDLDEIKHDPYVLLSIVSALHEGAWTIDEVQGTLDMLFEKQYILTETVETETKYRTETKTGERPARDPYTGEFILDEYGWQVMEEYEYEEDVPYTYYTCTVRLENFNLSHVPVYIMGEDELSRYALYMATLGNRPDLFPNSLYVTKYTGDPVLHDVPEEYLEDETFA